MIDLVFFDLEATGPDPATDRITQVGLLFPDGTTYEALVNPGREIPADVQRLTGISDALVAHAPPFAEIAAGLAAMLRDRPLAGFGVHHFDVPLLAEEFERAGEAFAFGPVVDAGSLFKIHEPRTLTAAMKFYRGMDHAGAHTAAADAKAAKLVLAAQLARYDGLAGLDPQALAEASRQGPEPADPFGKLARVGGVVCFNTHRNRGLPVSLDPGYAEWMLRSDFPLATKRAVRAELDRIERAAEAMQDLIEGNDAAGVTGDPGIPF